MWSVWSQCVIYQSSFMTSGCLAFLWHYNCDVMKKCDLAWWGHKEIRHLLLIFLKEGLRLSVNRPKIIRETDSSTKFLAIRYISTHYISIITVGKAWRASRIKFEVSSWKLYCLYFRNISLRRTNESINLRIIDTKYRYKKSTYTSWQLVKRQQVKF